VHVPDPLDPITLEELLEALKADPWCNDSLLQLQYPTRDTRPSGLILDPTGALCCLSVGHVDFPSVGRPCCAAPSPVCVGTLICSCRTPRHNKDDRNDDTPIFPPPIWAEASLSRRPGSLHTEIDVARSPFCSLVNP
jgi:hypothetical protein